jgi:3-hydroxyisobutyrate dehydrogenase
MSEPSVSKSVPAAKVAFIGLGVMGRSMARNLMQAGFDLRVNTRSPETAAALLEEGAVWADTPAEAVADADFVVTIVGFPSDVRQVYLGVGGPGQRGGILAWARPGAVLIDMTTSEPKLAKEIAKKAEARRLSALDAPVSGGDVGAQAGTLSIMVGGPAEAFDRALPLFEAMGKTIVLQGAAGAGQHCKMCNQIAIASNMIGVMEALVYARKAGLDPEVVLQSIGAGAAGSWSLSNLYPRVVEGDLGPGFYVEHFLKDIRIALSEAKGMGLRLPGLELADQLYQQVVDEGGARLGTQALVSVMGGNQ